MNEYSSKVFVYGAVLFVVIMVALFLFSGSDRDGRTEQVGGDIQSVRVEQQRASDEVREGRVIIGSTTQRVDDIVREVKVSRDINESSDKLIREGQQIVRAVKERNGI